MKVQLKKIINLCIKNFKIFLPLVLVMFVFFRPLFAEDAYIVIEFSKEIGIVNKLVFGNNMIAYDPSTLEDLARNYDGYSNFGAGIWDPNKNLAVSSPISLAEEAGVTVLRFPGGCGSHKYDWKKAVGRGRKQFLFGIDEFLRICQQLKAEPVFTLSYFIGNENDVEELMHYLISTDKFGNHKDWAMGLGKKSDVKPYNVKYFEVGNEDWHGDHKKIKMVSPKDYAEKYLKYYFMIKKNDPLASVGLILGTQPWNNAVMDIVKNNIDFGIIHMYPSPDLNRNQLLKTDAKDVFKDSLGSIFLKERTFLKDLHEFMLIKTKKDIPFAVTEFNGGFIGNEPVPYRFALGTALINAELLRVFLNPANNILLANYWQFSNSHWGMIANDFDGTARTLYNPYYLRPNFFVFAMYHKHFGDILLSSGVECRTYDLKSSSLLKTLFTAVKTGSLIRVNLLNSLWKIIEVDGVHVSEKDRVLIISFINPTNFNYYQTCKSVAVEPGALYKLSGYIKTEGLVDENGVCLEVQDARGWNQTKSAVSTEKIKGTTDWQHVEVIYETLPDAKAVNIIVRRIGEKGPLKGKAYFKDVKLEKFIPSLDTKIPYLSVNASKSSGGEKLFLMVINKNMDAPITATIDLKNFVPGAKGNAWVLNGPSVDATNEKNHDNVKVTHRPFEIGRSQDSRLKSQENAFSFEYTFEPHSLTAMELNRNN